MNTNNKNHDSHSAQPELDQHIAALRDVPTESSPPAATVAATLAMLRSPRITPAFVDSRPRFTERLIHMTFTQRIAAAVMITVGALTLYVMFTLFSTFGASVAFADVAEKFKQARTIQYNSTVTTPGMPAVTIRTLVAEPERMRTELPDGSVSIINEKAFVILNPKAKTAMRMNFAADSMPQDKGGNMVDAMRSLGTQKGEPLGEKEIDGIATVGFRVALGGRTMQIWADKKTAYPVRVEMTMAVRGNDAQMVMDKFVIDAPLDDSLFSLDPPAGYKLETKSIELPKIGEIAETVADLLKAYTAKSEGGVFPADLFDWYSLNKVLGTDNKDNAGKVGFVSGLLGGLESDEYSYAGKGAKLGEKDKIVFWHRPEDSKTFRAVYGDLRIEEVTADKLPATQPVKAPAEK
jgi:outer membrane lipoprotein-sorting protein